MRRFFCDTNGGVSTDWVVLVAALVGLGVAVLSTISTGTLDLAAGTVKALENQEPAATPTGTGTTITPVDLTNLPSGVVKVDQDEGGVWAYNRLDQLVDVSTGALLPILAGTTLDGSPTVYYNQRGEVVDPNGVLIDPKTP
ncbi:MAG: hypothetical protein AAF386_03960 [Pseudomonadota bacterium]